MGSQFWQVSSRQVRLFAGFGLVLFIGASAITAKAQTYLQNVGVPPFTTKVPVENGFINAANGNLHLEIPLGSFPQRGGPAEKIVLMYDSAFWSYAENGFWTATNISNPWQPAWGGWRVVTTRDGGYTTNSEQDSGNCNGGYAWARYNPWFYVAADGTQHTFNVTTRQPLGCVTGGIPAAAGYANDGSGFYISITNYTTAVVYAPDGTLLAAYPKGSEDTNGNYTSSPNTTGNPIPYVDTLGRTIMTLNNTGGGVYTLTISNPQGGQSTYTVRTGSINVCTNFGQQYVGEWCGSPNPLSITVVNEVDLPDGTKYTFNYDSGTTAGHYGTITSMTLPTGGTINYTFGVFQDDSINPDGSKNKYLWITSRSTPDGAWGYGLQVLSNCAVAYVNCQQQFTVTKPVVPPATTADTIVYTFTLNGGDWPTQVQYNDHASGVLATTTQCFNFVTVTNGSCSYTYTGPVAAATNVHLLATTTTLPIPSGNISATTEYSWDGYGNPTQISEWNFGNPPTNAADRNTYITYLGGAAYLPPNANIVNRPISIGVQNKAGATVAQTLYTYDVYTYNGGSLASVTGMPGHDDTNYGTNNTTRGNVTLIQNLVGSTYLNSYRNFDMTGQVTNAFDPSNQKTANTYACQNAYPTTITNPLSQVTTIGYDCNTGFLTSVKDANTQSTSFGYDNMFRPLSVGFPNGGLTSIQYNFASGFYTGSTTTKKVTSTQNLVTTDTVDGLGRVTSSVATSDPDGNTTVTTSFDTNSRVQSVSNPYRGTSNGSESYVYDALDRVLQITHVDGHVSSVYYGPSVGSQGGAASQLCAPGTYNAGYPILKIDEANNKLQSWIDGLGRTIEADEPTATSASLTANTCYGYDANNNLTGVLASVGNQTRSYTYDGVSRLTSKTDPESGTTTYTWDSDSSMCGNGAYTSNGDLVKITDADGHCLNRYFDALHRLTDVGLSGGCQRFRYDNTSGILGSLPSGLSISNPFGNLVEAETDTCAWPVTQSSIITDQWSSFDPMGRVLLNTQCTAAYQHCGTTSYSTLNYGYDLLGDMTSYTNGAGVTITQGPFSGAGRLTSVTSSLSDSNHPGTLLTNVHYNALGEPTSATLGNGAVETLGYAPRGWPLSAAVQSQSTGTPGTGTVTINGSEQSHTNPPQNTSQGPNGAGSGADGGGGSVAWTNPNNITVAGQYASAATFVKGTSLNTDYLNATNFRFNLPSSTISVNGIQVQVSEYGSQRTDQCFDSTDTTDNGVYLLKAGSIVGSNHAAAGDWPTTQGTVTYGSSTDTWGTSWAYTDINSSNFGLAISANFSSYLLDTATCSNYLSLYLVADIYSVNITVWYTYQNGPTYDSGSVTVTANGTSTPPASYGNGSTGSSIASQLASSISAFGFVTASNNGTNVITITSTTNGANTNYSLSGSSQSNAGFSPPSFTASPSGSTLTGGTGAPGTLYSFSLGYGAGNSNVTAVSDSINGSWTYGYDNLNRLISANQNSGVNVCSFGYDQLGNRTSQTATAGSCGNLSLSYAGNNNRMDGYSYDAAGNLLSDGLHTYAYDAENRLITVDGGTTASYIYDAEGRRVQKTAGAQVEYLYDLNGNIVTELSSAGGWNRGEVFANGQHLATYNNGTTYFDHADWLGTERARSNMADANCETITNLPFGDSQGMSGTSTGNCVDANPQHFTGQQWDSESNLHYFGTRHYSSQFGRFMSPDPTGIFLGNLNDPQQLNLYAYVRNNSTSMTDPSGLVSVSVCVDCGGGFDIPISIGFGWGGGGHGDWGGGPEGPSNTPANVGMNPNPPNSTSAADDPFSGETNGIPNGLQVPMLGIWGLTLPSDPGCFFGTCGGGLIFDENNSGAGGGYQSCMSNFRNSAVGKGISFFSLLNFIANAKDWIFLTGGKIAGVTLIKAEVSAGVTNYSITAGTATAARTGLQTVVTTGSEVVGWVGTAAVTAATLIDAQARMTCDPSYSAPPTPLRVIF